MYPLDLIFSYLLIHLFIPLPILITDASRVHYVKPPEPCIALPQPAWRLAARNRLAGFEERLTLASCPPGPEEELRRPRDWREGGDGEQEEFHRGQA